MDTFESNLLYRSFMTKFKKEFEMACKLSYIIAIPQSHLLEDIPIDLFLANSHLLMPSKLLKMHYNSLQVGYCDDIELDGKKLILTNCKGKPSGKVCVNILAEEIVYNAYNKEFRVILIDQLLINHNRTQRGVFFRKSPSAYRGRKIRPAKPLTSHDDCARYLEFLSVQVTADLERDIKRLQTNYMMLSNYLSDAAYRIKNLVEIYVHKYEGTVLDCTNIICDSARQAIQLALENYTVHLLHGKLMVSIHSLYGKEDETLLKKFSYICNSKLTLCHLGAQPAFMEFVLSEETISEIRRLPYLQSPLSMVSSIMRLVNMLSEGLDQSVQFKALTCDASCFDRQVSICSDDLIATFVYSLAHAKPVNLYSVSKYLELFGLSSSSKDQAAYYTTTFQVVIHYILNFEHDPLESSGNCSLDSADSRTTGTISDMADVSETQEYSNSSSDTGSTWNNQPHVSIHQKNC